MARDYEQVARALRMWQAKGPGDEAVKAVSAATGMPPADVAAWIGPSSQRLAVYGTLAPGKSNHGQLAGLAGTWTHSAVRGTLRQAGWGQTHGYPGLIWNPTGERVAVQVFESRDLEQHWARLDAFEGEDYQRLLIPVELRGELAPANIYALSDALALEFGDQEVHLWQGRLDVDDETAAFLQATLCDDERERAGRFRLDRDRRRFIAARGWLRVLVGRYRGEAPAAVRIAYGPKGKPYVDGGPRFNVSHSGEVALLAFCEAEEIGVDIEALREMDDAENILRRHAAPAEVERWMAAAPGDRARMFFQAWTRIEAVGKALGGGLSEAPPASEGWSLLPVDPGNEYVASVAVRGEGWRVVAMGQCSRGISGSEDRSC